MVSDQLRHLILSGVNNIFDVEEGGKGGVGYRRGPLSPHVSCVFRVIGFGLIHHNGECKVYRLQGVVINDSIEGLLTDVYVK